MIIVNNIILEFVLFKNVTIITLHLSEKKLFGVGNENLRDKTKR